MLPSLETKRLIFEQINYEPYEEQMAAHSEEDARLILIAGGERAGKSRWSAAEVTAAMMIPNNQIAVCGQDYDQSKKEVRYVIEDLQRLGALSYHSTPKAGRWEARSVTGSWLETVSLSDGAGELTSRGESYDLVLIVEAGRVQDKGILRASRGRVAETRGRALFSGTLWDNFGWYSELYDTLAGPNLYDGVRYTLPSWKNTAIFPGGLNDPEIQHWKSTLSDEEFARFVAAKKIKPPSIIYKEFEQDIHVSWDCVFNPDAPVDISIDPGYFPSRYSILAIQSGVNSYGMDCVNIIDEVWVNNMVHQEVIQEAKDRIWWSNLYRAMGGHETLQHAATKSTKEVWLELLPRNVPFEVCKKYSDRERIMRVKTLLVDPQTKAPRIMIHPRCVGLAKEFREWRRKTDNKGAVISDRPIDEMEDALDCLGNYLLHTFGPVDYQRERGQVRAGTLSMGSKG